MPFCLVHWSFDFNPVHFDPSLFCPAFSVDRRCRSRRSGTERNVSGQTGSHVYATSLSKLGRIRRDDMRAHAMLTGYLLQQQQQQQTQWRRITWLTSLLAWCSCRLRVLFISLATVTLRRVSFAGYRFVREPPEFLYEARLQHRSFEIQHIIQRLLRSFRNHVHHSYTRHEILTPPTFPISHVCLAVSCSRLTK